MLWACTRLRQGPGRHGPQRPRAGPRARLRLPQPQHNLHRRWAGVSTLIASSAPTHLALTVIKPSGAASVDEECTLGNQNGMQQP